MYDKTDGGNDKSYNGLIYLKLFICEIYVLANTKDTTSKDKSKCYFQSKIYRGVISFFTHFSSNGGLENLTENKNFNLLFLVVSLADSKTIPVKLKF